MQYISLLELNLRIKNTLSSHLEPSYWVVAEISELRIAPKGHCYLELIEKEGDFLQAKLKATIWGTTFRNISSWFQAITGQSLKPGMKILANLKIEFHEQFGLSANIKEIDPKFTLGERAKRKQEIIDQLIKDGIYEMNKTVAIPMAAQRIAIISSQAAAGYGDFLHQLNNNEYGYKFEIDLYPAVMQGCESPPSIINALYAIYDKIDDYDVVAIIRGGGAQVDMDCFDDYELASHVAQFPIPVLTGIGHERDESVTDLVAHTKLKTPTAVSAFLISGLVNFEQKLESLIQKTSILATNYCKEQQYKLDSYTSSIHQCKSRYWEKQTAILSQLELKLQIYPKKTLDTNKDKINWVSDKIKHLTKIYFKEEHQKIQYINNTVKLSDPELILKKGYTITYIQNKLLKDAEVDVNKVLVTRSNTMSIESIITKASAIKHDKKEI